MTVTRATVLICTYNRADLLRETLEALQAMAPPSDCDVEIVIVDNNSTDATRDVVAAFTAGGQRFPVRYLHEVQQGKSFALNLGLRHSRGDVIALTDDDVLPADDWLSRVVSAFRAHDVTFVFGKVLPRWSVTPPPEMLTERAQHIWGPLALLDYGDTPMHYAPESCGQGLPIGANLSFSREALLTLGGWRTDLGKVNNTLISGEDHEIFMRLRRHDLYRGLYDPENYVRHYVPAERLTRTYFRRWFYWSGKTRALMLQDLYPELDINRVLKLAGTPRFLFREGLEQAGQYLRTVGRNDALGALVEELKVIQYAGLYVECWRRRHRIFPADATPVRGADLSPRHEATAYE
jgi:glycosyltransferase involved in cell wall biosynthesis